MKHRKMAFTISVIIVLLLVFIITIIVQVDKNIVKTEVEKYIQTRYHIPYHIIEMKTWNFKDYHFRLKYNEQESDYLKFSKETGIHDKIFQTKIEMQMLLDLSAYLKEEAKEEKIWIHTLMISIINEPDVNWYLDYRVSPPSYEVFIHRILEKDPSASINLKIGPELSFNPIDESKSIYYLFKFLDSKGYFFNKIAGEFYEGKKRYYMNPFTSEEVKQIIVNNDLEAIEKNITIEETK